MSDDVALCFRKTEYAIPLEAFDRFIKKLRRGKKKPESTTRKWEITAALNTRVEPLLSGRKKIELVVKMGGKRKPRKKG